MKAKGLLHKVIVCIAAACLAVSGLPAAAFAADASQTASVGGWEFSYVVSNNAATVVKVSGGSGPLSIPTSLGGAPVTALGEEAASGLPSVTSVTLPDTVSSLGRGCFYSSSLTSIALPASVPNVPSNCFQNCSSLATVEFEGGSMTHLGDYAFYGCSALKEITIPALMGPTRKVGDSCFAQCTGLETIRFLAGSKLGMSDAYSGATCYAGCTNIKEVVYFCKGGSLGWGSAASTNNSYAKATTYYTINFYMSEADVEAGNAVGSATYLSGTPIADILSGKAGSKAYSDGSGKDYSAIPSLPQGQVWGFSYEWDSDDGAYEIDNQQVSVTSGLSDTVNAVAVSKGNMDYAWVSSDYIDSTDPTSPMHGDLTGETDYYTFYRNLDGSVDNIDQLEVFSPTGEVLQEGVDCELEFQTASAMNINVEWTTVSAQDARKAGIYRVFARGIGANADTATQYIYFFVSDYLPASNDCTGSDAALTANLAALVTGSAVAESNSKSVLVPASSWQYQLVGSGLAGVGNGIVIYDPGTSKFTTAVSKGIQAFYAARSDGLAIVGSTSQVSQAGESIASNVMSARDITPARIQGASVQKTANAAYELIRDKGQSVWGATWGATAIVVSATKALDALPIAQYAYQYDAPVFFAEDDGSISKQVLGYLSSGSFDQVIIAGDESYVSAQAAGSIATASGITPTRLLDGGTNACSDSLGFAARVEQEGECPAAVYVASASSAAQVNACAIGAAVQGGVCLVCAASADSKAVQERVMSYAQGCSTGIGSVTYVGDFSKTAPDVLERIESVWGSSPMSMAADPDDTVEVDGMVCSLNGSSASLQFCVEPAITGLTLAAVTCNGTSYPVTTVAAGAFSGCSSLASLSLPSVQSIAAGCFKGNTVLKKVTLAQATSIGANAFNGCTALETAVLGSSALKSIGKSAFCQCKKLASLTVKSAKLAAGKVGAKAFKGVAAKIKVYVPQSKIKTYKKIFAAKGMSSKATYKKC